MKPIRFLALAAFAVPVLAHAHPGHEGHELTWDFASGAAHPLAGWDHLLAMIAVGLWAARLDGRGRWLVPAAFVSVMGGGALLGQSHLVVPGTEQAIAVSILVLGLLIATASRLCVPVGAALVGLFAVFHGLAHGAEMPATVNGLNYGIGFVVATALLHGAGFAFGVALKDRAQAVRFAGSAIAIAGAVALLA